ncbi:MAG: hypothetical protein ACXWBH_06090 [Candidatus Angelobacter sp.]
MDQPERRYTFTAVGRNRIVPFWDSGRSNPLIARQLALSMAYRSCEHGVEQRRTDLGFKGPDPQPAIRNALHLEAVRNNDPETLRYLELADSEITRIAAVLKNANQVDENKQVHVFIPFRNLGSAA